MVHGRLGRAVDHRRRIAGQVSGDRPVVDDAARALLHHDGRRMLHAEHHRAHQQRHGLVEAFDRDRGDAARRRRAAGIVEDVVELAERPGGLADHALPVVLERGIGLDEAAAAAELGSQRFALGLAAAGEDDLGAFLHEQLGRARPDAAGGPGNDRDLAVEHAHCAVPLCLFCRSILAPHRLRLEGRRDARSARFAALARQECACRGGQPSALCPLSRQPKGPACPLPNRRVKRAPRHGASCGR